MQGSKEMRSYTLRSNGVKEKESHGSSAICRARRAIDILKRDPDWPKADADLGELVRKYISHSVDEEWLNVVNSKSYRDVNKKSPENCTLPSLQPIVLLDKLDNRSLELPAQSGYRAFNGHTVDTTTPLERRKFFRTSPRTPTPSISDVYNEKHLDSSPHMKFGRERNTFLQLTKSKTSSVIHSKGGSIEFEGTNNDTLLGKANTPEQIVHCDSDLSSNGRMHFTRCSTPSPIKRPRPGTPHFTRCSTPSPIKKARPGTPFRVNGIREECRILKHSWSARDGEPDSCSKRKASFTKNCSVKARKLDGNSEDNRRGTRSYLRSLLEDQSDKCENIQADVNELQNFQNGRIVNQFECAREAVGITLECEQERIVDHVSEKVMEDGLKDPPSSNVMDSNCKSTANCNAVESTILPDASVSKTSSVNGQTALYAMSPSLQPVVLLRRLTCAEIRHYSQKNFEGSESKDSSYSSSDEFPLSFVKEFHRKFYDRDRKGCLKCVVPSSGDKSSGQSSELTSPERGSEASACRTVSHMPATSHGISVVWNSITDKPNTEGSCNGVKEYTFDKITACSDGKVIGRDELSSTDVGSSDFSTAKRTPPFTALGSDKRKCCGNDMCRVATPELIGLENPSSNRCWMNVTLQTLFSMESFMRNMIIAAEDVNAEDNSLISCILTLYYARYLGHQECVYEQARKLAEVLGTLNSNYILNDQQDPSEFILWLFNAIEPALEKYGPSWASSLITEYFRFEMEEKIRCVRCKNCEVRLSSFLILMLDIDVGTSKVKSIHEALGSYTSTKISNRTCAVCGEEKSRLKTAFKSFPRYLIINLKRYSMKEGEVILDETPVKHPNTLSLGNYSHRNSKFNCSSDRRSVAVASPPKFNIGRKNRRRNAGGDYDLISIIHHSGVSVSSGHYVCDVYHASTNKWYSYNDIMVKEISKATLSSTKRQKTGYIYVYENKYC